MNVAEMKFNKLSIRIHIRIYFRSSNYCGKAISLQKAWFNFVPQMLAFGFDWRMERPFFRRKTPLAVDGTRIQVHADSMTTTASTLNHSPTQTLDCLSIATIQFQFIEAYRSRNSFVGIAMFILISGPTIINKTNQCTFQLSCLKNILYA